MWFLGSTLLTVFVHTCSKYIYVTPPWLEFYKTNAGRIFLVILKYLFPDFEISPLYVICRPNFIQY
jgi:hypothetical protein